jgi:hypothetical protein
MRLALFRPHSSHSLDSLHNTLCYTIKPPSTSSADFEGVVNRLAAILSALAAVDAALAALLAHEAAAEHGETAHKAAAVLLLLGGRSLLLVHGLLVLHLLGRRALLVSLLGVAENCQYEVEICSEKGGLLTLAAGRTTAAGTAAAAGCCNNPGQTLWKCCYESFC